MLIFFHTGPSKWSSSYSMCAGKKQSPIDIIDTKASPIPMSWQYSFVFFGYNIRKGRPVLHNTGRGGECKNAWLFNNKLHALLTIKIMNNDIHPCLFVCVCVRACVRKENQIIIFHSANVQMSVTGITKIMTNERAPLQQLLESMIPISIKLRLRSHIYILRDPVKEFEIHYFW